MTGNRKSKTCRARITLLAIVAILANAGCGGGGGTTAAEFPEAARHPDGVVIEPPPALPLPSERARARGVIALREPLGEEAAREAIRVYVTAFEREDLESLERLLEPTAVSLEHRGGAGSRAALIDGWRTRIKQLDYSRIAGADIVSPERIEHFEVVDLGPPGAPPRPDVMESGDLLVRASVSLSRVSGERYFGDTIVLVLRRHDSGGFRIVAAGEDGW